MDINQNVVEAHLSTGTTLPLRATQAKSGNRFWGTLSQKANGERYYSRFGVSVPLALVGDPRKLETIKVEGIGTIKVTQEVTQDFVDRKTGKVKPGGKPRAIASRKFTADDGEEWVLDFRATLQSDDIVNVDASIHRARGNVKPRVQASL